MRLRRLFPRLLYRLRGRESSIEPNHGLKQQIADSEELTRFVYSSRHYSRQNSRIKWNAFEPRNSECSVTRLLNLSDNGVWEIGEAIGNTRKQKMKARADISAKSVRKPIDGLSSKLDVESHPVFDNRNHANIIGWPSETKKIKTAAKSLANRSKAKLPPTTNR